MMKWTIRILQAVLVLGFLSAGLSKVFSGAAQVKEMFTDVLGTPAALIYTVGVVETLAALALIAGYRSRKAAFAALAVLFVIMAGAVVWTLVAGEASSVPVPLAYLALVCLVFFLKRRTARSERLPGSAQPAAFK